MTCTERDCGDSECRQCYDQEPIEDDPDARYDQLREDGLL